MNVMYIISVLVFLILQSHGAKILLIPIDHHSSVNALAMIGKALKQNDHDVWILASQRHEKAIRRAVINPILFQPSDEAQQMKQGAAVQQKLWHGVIDSSGPRIMINANIQCCRELLGNDKIMRGMTDIRFDLAVVDDFYFAECLYLIPYYLDVPHVTFSSQPKDPWSVGLTALPSIEPSIALSFTNKMSFMERLLNTGLSIVVNIVRSLKYFSMDISEIKKYIPHQPLISNYELSLNTLLTLVHFEPVCFDYPRVSAPNYHYIGGASAEPAKPLPVDLKDFVEGASDGVIVMTFGSIPALATMPTPLLRKFMDAFRQLKQRVILRQESYEITDIPSNVRILKWVPQNDLLGHPNTKLFITHGGNSGQMEALYHGVPMLVMPVFADQIYTASRAVQKGYGSTLNLQTFTPEVLYDTVQELVNNASYGHNINKCSKITKSLPSAGSIAVFWIEHVLKFGGEHLKTPGAEMPMWQLLCLDVLLFLQFILMIFVLLGFCCCRFTWRCLCKGKKKKVPTATLR